MARTNACASTRTHVSTAHPADGHSAHPRTCSGVKRTTRRSLCVDCPGKWVQSVRRTQHRAVTSPPCSAVGTCGGDAKGSAPEKKTRTCPGGATRVASTPGRDPSCCDTQASARVSWRCDPIVASARRAATHKACFVPELWTPLTMGSDRNALPSVDYPTGLWSSSCMKRNGRLIDKPLKEFLSLQIRQKSFFLNQKSLISDFLPTIGDQMSKSHKHQIEQSTWQRVSMRRTGCRGSGQCTGCGRVLDAAKAAAREWGGSRSALRLLMRC